MPGPSRDIVWIASYPKSGNTWIRFLACHLLYGPQESAAAIGVLAPDIHEIPPERRGEVPKGLLKTHFACSDDLPLAGRTAAALYIARRPEDVLVSNFFYAQRSLASPDASRAAFDRYVEEFIVHRGDPRWIGLGMGSWEENVRSWLCVRRPFPVVSFRFEDLARDGEGVAQRLAQLLRPQSTAAEIRQAVESCSFRRLREIEEADIAQKRVGIFYKPYLESSIAAGRRFMREGAVRAGHGLLTPAQRARLRETFEPLMTELGYCEG